MTNRWQAAYHRLRGALPAPLGRWLSAGVQHALSAATRAYRGWPGYRHFHERRVRELAGQVMRRSGRQDRFYEGYVKAQLDDSLHFIHGQVLGPRVMDRTIYLAGLLDRVLPAERGSLRMVCIGCRNGQELDHLQERCGIRRLDGLDLQSADPRIRVGDMHHLPFLDDAYDILYACHSLEHAYDLDRVLLECFRVTKSGGVVVIEMPVKYRVDETDRWDVGSTGQLLAYLGSFVGEPLVAEDDGQNARTIFRLRKPGALAATSAGAPFIGVAQPS